MREETADKLEFGDVIVVWEMGYTVGRGLAPAACPRL